MQLRHTAPAGLRLTATGDSDLVIQAMLARRDVHDDALTPLSERARALVHELESLGCIMDFTHVRRALNGAADQLANTAMDEKASALTRSGDFVAARCRLLPLSGEHKEEEADGGPLPIPRSGRIPLLSEIPSRDQLHMRLSEFHKDSRVLSRLPPTKLWSEHTTLAWTSACASFTPQLAAALDSGSELSMTQMLLDLIELPSRTLREHCPGLRPEDKRRARTGEEAAATTARGSPPDLHPGAQIRRASHAVAIRVYAERSNRRTWIEATRLCKRSSPTAAPSPHKKS